MKKFLQYIITFILIIFILPAILTTHRKVETPEETKIQEFNQIQEFPDKRIRPENKTFTHFIKPS